MGVWYCQVVERHAFEPAVKKMPNLSSNLLQYRSVRNVFPKLQTPKREAPLLFSVGVVTAIPEEIAHPIMDRSETLQATRGFEAAHHHSG
jgi:hypothetical protein